MSYQPLEAGRLDKRVTIQSRAQTDDYGNLSNAWSAVVTVWAAIESPTGSESVVAQQVEAVITHVIRIRYRSGVTAKNRFAYGTRLFSIHAVIDVDERHEQLVCYCSEVAA